MTATPLRSPRWMVQAVRVLHLALLGASFAVIFSNLPTPLAGHLLSTLVIMRLAVAGVFGAATGDTFLYDIPRMLRAPRSIAAVLLIFIAYLVLMTLLALNGMEWDGLAARICVGAIIGSDLYLVVSDAVHGAPRKRSSLPDPALTQDCPSPARLPAP